MKVKNSTPEELKKRTQKSLSIFAIVAVVLVTLIAVVLTRQSPTNRAPPPLRQVLEFNGRLWKKIFSASRPNHPYSEVKGQPRVNGLIGLEEPVDLNTWQLDVVQDDQDPRSKRVTLKMADILKLPRTDTSLEFRCIEGWSEDMSFAGVRFSEFMKAFGFEGRPYVGFETNDGKYYVSVDIESMLHPQTLLAYEMNGAPLASANGAPLRLVIPNKYGIKNLKRIGKIFFSDVRPRDYWAERGYDWHSSL